MGYLFVFAYNGEAYMLGADIEGSPDGTVNVSLADIKDLMAAFGKRARSAYLDFMDDELFIECKDEYIVIGGTGFII